MSKRQTIFSQLNKLFLLTAPKSDRENLSNHLTLPLLKTKTDLSQKEEVGSLKKIIVAEKISEFFSLFQIFKRVGVGNLCQIESASRNRLACLTTVFCFNDTTKTIYINLALSHTEERAYDSTYHIA